MDIVEENVVGTSVIERNRKDVGKFLNRILGLEVDKQNLVSWFGYLKFVGSVYWWLIHKTLEVWFIPRKTHISTYYPAFSNWPDKKKMFGDDKEALKHTLATE